MHRLAVVASVLALGLVVGTARAQPAEKTAEEILLELAARFEVGLLLDDGARRVLRERRLVYAPTGWAPTTGNAVTMLEGLLRTCDLPFERCPPEETDPKRILLVVRGRPPAAAAPARAPGPRVGVVDLEALFAAHPRKEALEAELNARREQVKAGLEREQERLRELRARLDQAGDDAARERLGREVDAAASALEARMQAEQEALKEHVERVTRQLMDELRAVVGELGRREGFAAIHAKQAVGEEARRGSPVVLWADVAIDVTRAAIALLREQLDEQERRSY